MAAFPQIPTPLQWPPTEPTLGAPYVLAQIIAVPNWHVVTWTGIQHVTHRAYLLGLANNPTTGDPSKIIALTYTANGGWRWADDETDPTVCGLLPPDQDLVPFEASNPCGHTPPVP